jgi:uncharacterized membrane protein
MRTRKFVGALALIAFVLLYAFFAAAVGDVAMRNASWPAQAAYFLIAGLLWIFPAALIIWWMQRPRASDPS